MDQLARLGVVFGQEGADPLIKNLEKVAATSKAAEAATESFSNETKKAAAGTKAYSTGVDDMNAHLVAYKGHLAAIKVANDNAIKSQRALGAAGLNLGRQFSDVGVSLASGINPLMVLIQQGPQIADGFQVASAAGLNFKTVIKGLWTEITPLIAAFAPWAAGLAAVGAGVWYLVDAHNKQRDVINDTTKAIDDQDKALRQLSPMIFKASENADLAADGQRNFDNWLRTANVSIAEQNKLLKQNALDSINAQRAKAAGNLFEAQMELARVSKPGPAMMSSGIGGFSAIAPEQSTDPTNNPFYKQAAANEKKAKEASEAINDYYQKMLKAPDSAFGPKPAKTPKVSQADQRKAAAIAEGRYATGSGADRGVVSIATVGQENYTPGHLNKYSPGGDKTINGDPMIQTAEEASRRLEEIQKERARNRLETERDMWSGLTALSNSGNKKLAAIGKAAAIAEATIDGIKAVQKAYASLPFPFNLAAAATMAGLTAINVAKIAGVKGFASGGYTGNGGVGEPAGVVHGQEFVMNAAATRQNRSTLEAMNAGRAIPKNPANSNSKGAAVMVVPSPLFDVVVAGQARQVATPIARAAANNAADNAVQASADAYVRRNIKRLV